MCEGEGARWVYLVNPAAPRRTVRRLDRNGANVGIVHHLPNASLHHVPAPCTLHPSVTPA
jgi:hypothetical protein